MIPWLQSEQERKSSKHFKERCLERGIVSTDVDLLYNGLKHAIVTGDENLAERVMASGVEGRSFYRFKCPDGIFFAICDDETGRPVTVYNHAQLKSFKKRKRRLRR